MNLMELAKNSFLLTQSITKGMEQLPVIGWEELDAQLRDAHIQCVKEIVANPKITAEALHNFWRTLMIERKWTVGTDINPEIRAHSELHNWTDLFGDVKARRFIVVDYVNSHKNLMENIKPAQAQPAAVQTPTTAAQPVETAPVV